MASAPAAAAAERPYHLQLVPAFPDGPLTTRTMAADPRHVEYLRQEFSKAIKTEAELIEFLRTYDPSNPEQYTKLNKTIHFKTIPNIALWLLKNNRGDIIEKRSLISFDFDEVTDEETAFTYTVKMKNIRLFMMIGKIAKLEACTDTVSGNALHRAVRGGMFEFVAGFLILLRDRQYGYSPEQKLDILNSSRKAITHQNAVYAACARNQYPILELLLAAGADPNAYFMPRLKITILFQAIAFGEKEEPIKILLAYGADPNMPRDNGTLPADFAKSKGKVQIEKILRNAMAKKTVLYTPTYVTPAAPLKYIFSQRGSTCGPDTLFTIFFEADPIREDFQAALDDDSLLRKAPAPVPNYSSIPAMLTYTDALTTYMHRDRIMEVFSSVIPRYKKMKSLEKKSPTRRIRKESLNTSGGSATLECITNNSSNGTSDTQALRLINTVLLFNRFGILKRNYHLKAVQINTFGIDGEIPPLEKVFAYKIRCGFPDRMGHIFCIIKQEGKWYFGDNEAKALHQISDLSVVEEFHTLATNPETISTMAYVIARERKTSSVSMIGYLVLGNRHYPPEYGRFSMNASPIAEVVMIYQDRPTSPWPAAAAAAAAAPAVVIEEAAPKPAKAANEGGARRRQTRRVRGAKRF